MPPLYEQRAKMLDEVAGFVLIWLSLLDAKGKYNVIRSMVGKYSLSELKFAKEHIEAQILRLQKGQADGRD